MSSCLRALRAWIGAALFGSALLLATASPSSALTFTIDASDSGHHDQAGNHTDVTNETYSAGWENEELRNFFVFDLSGLPASESVLSVTLRLYNPAVGEPDETYTGGYESADATELYTVREILLPAATVTAPTVANPAVFTAIGAGTAFGSAVMSLADNGQNVDIALNAAGIASVQSFVGVPQYVLGGTVDSLTGAFGDNELVFNYSDPLDQVPGSPYTRQLIVTMTPEPGTGALFALGLVTLASVRGRRTRRIG